jgi:hypothetical protein
MIHILTVHWKSDLWIDLQLSYLKHHIKQPHQVYAFLNHVPKAHRHTSKFHYCSTEDIRSHAVKLNILADLACQSADEDDYLMFLDGDAFPVSSIDDFVDQHFPGTALAAVQRLDNSGDIQPHPCFCITTVRQWRSLPGDWKPGRVSWTNDFGEQVQDVGGKLMAQLERQQVNWLPLNRSNTHDLHPVLFGIYGGLIYHHGAGFRMAGIRCDRLKIKHYAFKNRLYQLVRKVLPFRYARQWFFPMNQTIQDNQALSQRVIDDIKQDFYFYRQFMDQ